MTKNLLRDIKLKSGITIPKGTPCAVSFIKTETGSTIMEVTPSNGQTFKTRGYSIFFKQPTLPTLSRWVDDGIAKTVTGHRTEPDGFGPDGSPSWLLALGMI